jgi:glucans biosynthesis protein C
MTTPRRYDIDWIRVIAIALLMVYHTAVGFQPWGTMIAFITSEESWESLWVPMTMLNVWRIPLLFFVSGMGVYFAMQNRTWKQLLMERSKRILVPYVFGFFCIVPIHLYLFRSYLEIPQAYTPSPGHLWFLGNIFCYVLICLPFFVYLKKNQTSRWMERLRQGMTTPLGLLPMLAMFVGEVLLLRPMPFEFYAMTSHGFFLGLIGFFSGFYLMLTGDVFWKMIVRWRVLFLLVAAGLFVTRTFWLKFPPGYLLSIESNMWILSVFAFGHLYLNRSHRYLSYLSQAAYPVYILHMVFLYLGSMFIFPWGMPLSLQFLLLVLVTVGGSLACFEGIRRVRVLRFLFGVEKGSSFKKPTP